MAMQQTSNIYKDGVNFASLALSSPEFAKHLKSNGQLDFTNPESVRQLTKALLWSDFHLRVEIPENRLCPPVPNRLNYVLWLADLLATTGEEHSDTYDYSKEVLGLDIGTGCCGIYPLIACKLNPSWRFIATDIDDENFRGAERAFKMNGFDTRIQLLKQDPSDNLIPIQKLSRNERFDFTMCNPPFYASQEEMLVSAQAKKQPPFSACTGAEIEMVTPGGEVAFVSRMIDESLQLRQRVRWYTSMLGKLSSVSVLVERLIGLGNKNYAVTEFVQGSKTKRWAIAWSWMELRPPVTVARDIPGFPKHLLPFPSEYAFELSSSSIDDVSKKVDAELTPLHMQWQWKQDISAGLGFAMQNVWSRQYRRKMDSAAAKESIEIDDKQAALGFRVRLKMNPDKEKTVQVSVQWLRGTDSVLFESFCGMLKRKLEGR